MQRRGLVHAGAWMLATGGAVMLSWFGVHTVLEGTAYDPPRAHPVADGAPDSAVTPQVSSTHRPRPRTSSPVSSPSLPRADERTNRPTARPGGSANRDGAGHSSGSQSPSPTSHGNVKSASVTGGRAVFDMGPDSATLVSATPNAGWDMRVWRADTWIRVTFGNGSAEWSIFCRWEDGHPRIETYQG